MAWPSDLLFYATYDSSFTADYSKYGDPIPVETTNVVIDTTTKVCGIGSANTTALNSRIKYSGGGEVTQKATLACWFYCSSSQSQGTIELFHIIGIVDRSNWIRFYADVVYKKISLLVRDEDNNTVIDVVRVGSFTQDTWHHVEADFDLDTGVGDIFIDGVSVGGISIIVSTRQSITDYLYIFKDYRDGHFIDDSQIYNTVRHTSNFSPACGTLPSLGPSNFNNFGFPFGSPMARGFGR